MLSDLDGRCIRRSLPGQQGIDLRLHGGQLGITIGKCITQVGSVSAL